MEDISKQNLELAVLHYTRAASEEPRQVNAMKRLGEVYLRQGDNQDAIYWLEQYMQSQPGTGDARYAQSLLKKAGK
jgi:TPR repeat protein